MVEIQETDDYEALRITRRNAFREIIQKQREAKIAGEEVFWWVGQDQNFTNYSDFENSFPQSIEQCRCELPWRDYLRHIYCPCLDVMEKVEGYKNIVLNIIERARTILDNYKNEVIAQIERELREKLPSNTAVIENSIQFRNWREEIRSMNRREEIEELKNRLINLAERLREINNEHEERRNQFQQGQEEWQGIQREMQERTREEIRSVGERVREQAEAWLEGRQEVNRKLEESIQKLTQEAEERQKKTHQEQTHKEEEERNKTNELSRECQDQLKKTDEYLNSLDSTESNSFQQPNKKSIKGKLTEKSGQGTIKKRDSREQVQDFSSTENTNPERYRSYLKVTDTNKGSGENHSFSKLQTFAVENQTEAKKPTLLIVGIVLIIGSALAIGYWLGKNPTPI